MCALGNLAHLQQSDVSICKRKMKIPSYHGGFGRRLNQGNALVRWAHSRHFTMTAATSNLSGSFFDAGRASSFHLLQAAATPSCCPESALWCRSFWESFGGHCHSAMPAGKCDKGSLAQGHPWGFSGWWVKCSAQELEETLWHGALEHLLSPETQDLEKRTGRQLRCGKNRERAL